jgi:hypothetical protein
MLRNVVLPLNKSVYVTIGILMLVAAAVFSFSNGFRPSSGHIMLATLGGLTILLGLFIREELLSWLSRWLILVNVLAAIGWFLFER